MKRTNLLPAQNRSHCVGRVAQFCLIGLAVWTIPQAAWAEVACNTLYPMGGDEVPCTDPSAVVCVGNNEECAALGFTVVSPFHGGPFNCVDPTCEATIASVPEFQDYAAILFVTLALLTGWRIRNRALVPA